MPHRDFTIDTYSFFLTTLSGRALQSFREFCTEPIAQGIILRHDIDAMPDHALRFAHMQDNLGIKGTYYFRIVPESLHPRVIEEIANLGHEVGYHYEDVSLAAKSLKAEKWQMKDPAIYQERLLEKAIGSFSTNLAVLRRYADVRTICMHGSPLSKWDSRLLWTKYNYRDFGLIGEPYFDIDFAQVAYYTDTGRRWDGDRVSRRDKIMNPVTQVIAAKKFPRFHTTFDIINAANSGELPEQIMFTFHPQRWHDHWLPWIKELVGQNVKNIVKFGLNLWNSN